MRDSDFDFANIADECDRTITLELVKNSSLIDNHLIAVVFAKHVTQIIVFENLFHV